MLRKHHWTGKFTIAIKSASSLGQTPPPPWKKARSAPDSYIQALTYNGKTFSLAITGSSRHHRVVQKSVSQQVFLGLFEYSTAAAASCMYFLTVSTTPYTHVSLASADSWAKFRTCRRRLSRMRNKDDGSEGSPHNRHESFRATLALNQRGVCYVPWTGKHNE